MKSRTIKGIAAVATAAFTGLLVFVSNTQKPARALPEFARQYNVPCSACHTSPPQLTKLGMAFQANYFNWPGNYPRPRASGLAGLIPVTAFVTSTYSNNEGGPAHDAQFDNIVLTAADGFDRIGLRTGGYWVEYELAENDGSRPGDLGNAFAALPVAGPNGELALNVGQSGPFDYQIGDAAYLTETTMAAIDNGNNGISFDSPTPQIALQYFQNRTKMTANGWYVDAGVPFGGTIDLNQDSRLYSAQGAYVHAFFRSGFTTNGIMAYRDGAASYEALIATRQPLAPLRISAAASTGSDFNGNQQIVSLQGDYVICPALAVSARYETLRGADHDEYPVYTINWYPFDERVIHLTGESVQDNGARDNTIYAVLQY